MRSAIAIAAFAAGVAAVPYNKREYVTDVELVYATEYVTVYAAAPSATAESYNPAGKHYGHAGWGQQSADSYESSSTAPVYVAPVPTTSSTVEAPVWTAPATTETSVYVAPTTSEAAPAVPTTTEAPPAPSTTETPVWVAPTTSEEAPVWVAPTTSVYVAPTTEAAPAPAPTAAAPAESSPSSGGVPTDYAGLCVYQHNQHRANHSSPALAWSDELAASAQIVASSCNYAHNVDVNGGGYGQNIAAGVQGKDIATIITDMFYNGEVNYFAGQYGKDSPDMSEFEKWGHFSQIVWKSTTHVGCATQDCSASGLGNTGGNVSPYFTVCNYKTPGNYAGEYAANIKAPSKSNPIESIIGKAFQAIKGY